jgi:serine/threonine-protein kinase
VPAPDAEGEATKRDAFSRYSFGSVPAAAPSPIAPGYKLERYELICPIAEGGMASVWIARQTGKHGFAKLVAVKTILPKYASDPKFQRMFHDEARIASRIEHANVAQILDVGEQHDVTYLVMEYVDGDGLSKLHRASEKRGQRVPTGILLRVMADVCGGLHAAHELRDENGQLLNVVHRDVSPQNVLVTTRGIAKLIDFGIAKARDRVAGDTNVDQVKGKVAYMAPEQAIGRPTDRRADVYAVGAVLYHLLAGRPPFQGDNDIQTLFALSSGRPPVPLPPSVHPAVSAVIKRALTHSPDGRYPTALAMQQALEEAMVTAGLVTSTNTVASYLADLVPDRAERRKQVIALGLKAAAEREAVARVMRSNADTSDGHSKGSGSGIVSVGSGSGSLKESVPSSAGETLGRAAVSLPMIERGRGRMIAVAAIVLGMAGVGTIALLASGSKSSSSAAAGAPPRVEIVQVPVPAMPPPASSDVPAEPSASAQAAPPPTARPAPARPFVAPRPTPKVKIRVNDGF